MAKRILGIVLVLAVIAVVVMAILESRSRNSTIVDSPVEQDIVIQDSILRVLPPELPGSLSRTH